MRLIRRPQITTLAFPRSRTWPSEAIPPLRAPWDFTPDALTFAKFILASPDYMCSELDGDLRELERELDNLLRYGGGEEMGVLFCQAAMDRVREEKESTKAFKTQWVMTARKKALRELVELGEKVGKAVVSKELGVGAETSSSEVEEDFPESLGGGAAAVRRPGELSSTAQAFVPTPTPGGGGLGAPIPKSRPQRKNVNPPPPLDQDSAYFFYQAASGQRIFLHPLDIRILKSHFGTYEGMPDTIEVSVEGADEGTMNEELRRRCRWLSHLPTAADVVFIEADLSKICSRESLEPYANALRMRRNKRKDKAKREDKAKAKSEQKEMDERPPQVWESYDLPPDSSFFPPPSSYANPTTAFQEPHEFPATTTTNPGEERSEAERTRRTVWGTKSFANTTGGGGGDERHDEDDDFDERWHDFEEGLRGGNRRPAANGGSGSRSGGSGGGATPEQAPRMIVAGGGGRRKKKLVLSLTAGAGGRGA